MPRFYFYKLLNLLDLFLFFQAGNITLVIVDKGDDRIQVAKAGHNPCYHGRMQGYNQRYGYNAGYRL
ncbi:hypothetical protein WH50_24010 [Pokkaliibacter plantistimulans]|uniref:Uncharacterized protein n=1 Tax=Pokkaliibacter plantistimulans TaxID=1635171 RepID=A0ABX5LQD0_9GAMM|nr:hypothetical protein WH50_24010 [Pokkaliibacter plantistimulans]